MNFVLRPSNRFACERALFGGVAASANEETLAPVVYVVLKFIAIFVASSRCSELKAWKRLIAIEIDTQRVFY